MRLYFTCNYFVADAAVVVDRHNCGEKFRAIPIVTENSEGEAASGSFIDVEILEGCLVR